MINEKTTSEAEEVVRIDDTLNVKKMLGRLRKKTADIFSDVIDEKPEAEIDNQLEIKMDNQPEVSDTVNESTAEADEAKGEKEAVSTAGIEDNTSVEEISIDIEDIKTEISEAVRSAIESGASKAAGSGTADYAPIEKDISEIKSELENIKKRLQVLQHATEEKLRDNGNNTTALHKATAELRDRVGEIAQTVNNVSKLSDSVFDLRNAQMNMKKALDVQESSLRRLRKNLSVSTVILSVIGVLIIMLQIIALLS